MGLLLVRHKRIKPKSALLSNKSTRKRHVERFFWEVVDIDRSHAWECKTIPGTRGFHSVWSSDNPVFEIWTRKLACFYPPCYDGDWDVCESLDWVDGWDCISLPLDQHTIVELTLLEEDRSYISMILIMYQTLHNLVWCMSLTFFCKLYVVLKLALMALCHMKNIWSYTYNHTMQDTYMQWLPQKIVNGMPSL